MFSWLRRPIQGNSGNTEEVFSRGGFSEMTESSFQGKTVSRSIDLQATPNPIMSDHLSPSADQKRKWNENSAEMLREEHEMPQSKRRLLSPQSGSHPLDQASVELELRPSKKAFQESLGASKAGNTAEEHIEAISAVILAGGCPSHAQTIPTTLGSSAALEADISQDAKVLATSFDETQKPIVEAEATARKPKHTRFAEENEIDTFPILDLDALPAHAEELSPDGPDSDVDEAPEAVTNSASLGQARNAASEAQRAAQKWVFIGSRVLY